MMEYKVAVAQMASNSENISENIERILRMMEKAAKESVKLIAFPELSLTPYFATEYRKDFRKFVVNKEDPEIRTIKQKAKELGISVAFGYAEEDCEKYYNSAMLVNSEGECVLNYRKAHLPAPMISSQLHNFEKVYFSQGNKYPVAELDGWKIGLQICYDRHFPEGYRALAYQGADLILNLTATTSYGTDWRSRAWKLLLTARAFENGVFVMGINKSGEENGNFYYGNSMIISPVGPEILALAEKSEEDVLLCAVLNMEDRKEAFYRLPKFRDLTEQERSWYEKLVEKG